MDKRLGKRGKDGSVIQNPNETVSGRPLPSKPYSTLEIGGGYFVVKDTFPATDDSETIAELKRRVKRPPSRAAKKGDADET